MGLLAQKLFALNNPEDPSVPLGSFAVLAEAMGTSATDAGVVVSERLAMHVPVVQACVRITAETIASNVPDIYERTPNGRRLADDHRLYSVLHDEPNPQMSAFTVFETGQASLSLWGNTYIEIQRDNSRRAVALWPLPPDRTRASVKNGRLVYVTNYTPTGEERTIEAQNILHVPGLSFDGITGMSPIALARQAIGLAIATERFGAQFFGNGARPGGVLTAPAGSVMTPDQIQRTRESWQSLYGGANAHKVAVLDGGLTFASIGIPPEDAQFLETRKFSVAEIARIFRVPLHMVGELERSTNNNIEHQSIEFVQNTILPTTKRWEHEINRKLFAGTNFYAEFDTSELLRGDFKSRQEGLAIQRQNGVINTNEWRDCENYNHIDEAAGGEKFIVQLNMQELDKVGQKPPAPDGGTPAARAAALRKQAREIEKSAEKPEAPKPQPIDLTVHAETPEVNVTVESPAVQVAAPEVHVHMDQKMTKKTITLRKDAKGVITGADVVEEPNGN